MFDVSFWFPGNCLERICFRIHIRFSFAGQDRFLAPVAPVVAWQLSARSKWSVSFWLRFLAGFCLIANGAYIGVGAFTRDGDGGDLLRDGSPAWTLCLFGIITVPSGLRLWHGLGADFGIGRDALPVPTKTVASSLLLLAVIVVTECLCAKL